MSDMLPRERVLQALKHQSTDQVPIDLGGWQSGISYKTYEPLKRLMQFEAENIISERVQGLAQIDDKVLDKFRVDTRYVFTNTEVGGNWRCQQQEDQFHDAWGIEWNRPKSSHYYDIASSPLREKTIDSIDSLNWPTAETFLNINGIQEQADRIIQNGHAVFTCVAGVFEQSTYIRGMEEFYMDIAIDTKYFETLMDRTLESLIDIYTRFFSVIGDKLDVVRFWGDLGTQRGPLISPETYRKHIKPRETELVKQTKKMTI